MKCPRDGSKLSRVIVAGVELDKCHKCDGIWCDYGEMEQLCDTKINEVEELLEEKYGEPDFVEGKPDGHMRCPNCTGDIRLIEYSVSYGRPMRLDRCQKCYGVWLDDGELNAVVEEKRKVDRITPEGPLLALLRAAGKAFKRDD